nr:DUF4249 domain-containing protein [Saprospiraceae bacterium]
MTAKTYFPKKLIFKSIGLFMGVSILFFTSCEEPFDPPLYGDRNEVVVEAFIEWNPENNLPPYVILSRSFPFTAEIDPQFIGELFIEDAEVRLSGGGKEVLLTSFCVEDLPPPIREEVGAQLGIDSFFVNLCLYIDIQRDLEVQPGETYQLEIEVEERKFQSLTTIPRPVPLDSLWAAPVPDPKADSLAQLFLRLSDPAGPDYYRYFTSVDGGALIPPLTSVTDDNIFDGQQFNVSILKAEPRGSEIDPATFGYFKRGSSVVLKWCTLDEDQFNFWETLEFSRNNQGPFSSYTLVSYNIEGEDGIGIFGGQSCYYYSILIPMEL